MLRVLAVVVGERGDEDALAGVVAVPARACADGRDAFAPSGGAS